MYQAEAEAMGRIVGRIFGLFCFPVVIMLIVAVLRLLIVRPRLSFRQALFRWWVLLIGAAAFVLGLLGLLASAVRNADFR
ncbi:MAG: hypothetical protein M3388_02410 [Acidobacteriota bacterium]|nr:hypothetical protein [Acidobacteriota bacterium]